jgi:hypothetical protein
MNKRIKEAGGDVGGVFGIRPRNDAGFNNNI